MVVYPGKEDVTNCTVGSSDRFSSEQLAAAADENTVTKSNIKVAGSKTKTMSGKLLECIVALKETAVG